MFTRTSDHPILECPSRPMVMERKWKPNIELAPSCPRCASSNTKFCYYNNYSLSQPRYFCKGCRRYWTKGGSLRNVPVRGGCRKSRRAKAARGVNHARQAPSPGVSTNESRSATDGAGIDLAAVFAKYLSQDSGNELKVVNDQDCSSGVTSGSSSSLENLPLKSMDFGDQLEDAMFEYQNPSDLIDTLRLDKGLFPGEENVQDLLELQSMLSDETGEDMLWSDHTSLPNFAWQTMVQLDDFGSFSIDDDHMKMSTDLVCDTWSTFDLSGYEIFSRP